MKLNKRHNKLCNQEKIIDKITIDSESISTA